MFHFGSCGLLKTPKVYNALITTDENITPSQSYPVIQPHIHETGIAYPAYSIGGYNHFGAAVFDPSGYSPYVGPKFINPGLFGRHNGIPPATPPENRNNNNSNQNGEREENEENIENEPSDNKDPESNESSSDQQQQQQQPELSEEQSPLSKSSQPINKPPIPLNEFGLPPNLIPINSYNFNYNPNPNPINLAPYPYNSYPLVYDQYTGYNQNPYLPPFGYYPQSPYDGIGTAIMQTANHSGKRVKGLPKKSKMQTHNSSEGHDSVTNQTSELNEKLKSESKLQFIPTIATVDIKNHANKNKDIPDVPPPPIPSGAKTTQD